MLALSILSSQFATAFLETLSAFFVPRIRSKNRIVSNDLTRLDR
eukprot:SAG11_NODE_7039_length_1204_cov_1.296833_2_plen_43_part_01